MNSPLEQCPPDVYSMVYEVIEKYHPELSGASFGLVFKNKMKSMGKVILGTVRKENDLSYVFSNVDFILCLNFEAWEEMTDKQRRAVVDHELCHCAPKYNKDGVQIGWVTVPHDLEEFSSILVRYGAYLPDRRDFVSAIFKTELKRRRKIRDRNK